MKLTRRLTLLVSVPLAVAVGFAGLAVESSIGKASDADDLRTLVVAAETAGRLAYELQAERSAAALSMLPNPAPDALDVFQRQSAATDAEAAAYRDHRSDISSAPGEVRRVLAEVDAGLAGLAEVRDGVRMRKTSLSAAGFNYRILIAALLEYRAGVGQFGRAQPSQAEDLRAVADLSRASESAGRMEVAVLRALGRGAYTSAAQQEIIEARAAYNEALRTFAVSARPEWQALLEHELVGEQLARAQRLEDLVARTESGENLAIDKAEWAEAMSARIARLRAVEVQIDKQIVADVTDVRDDQVRWTIGEIIAVLIAVILAAIVVIRMGRRLISRLRSLQESAHQVAYERLPAAVAALREPDVLGSSTPAEFAAEAGKAVRVDGKDEIAEVGESFRTVFEEAVRLAADLSGERAGVSAILVNLARRGQVQTNDLLRVLDRAEEREADPERLERLYAIDHHVNLMRRTHDNLLVLGGEGSARVRDDTMLVDVVRVAAQRIKHYTRVHLPGGNVGVTVAGRATDPLAHLLAELLDNATTFSPPGTPVTVEVGVQGDHAVVHIADQGFGLQPERRAQLNARLSGGLAVDLDAVRLMGLTVVSTLAERLGVRVLLESGPDGGTVAVVELPPAILTTVRRVGRHRAKVPEAAIGGAPARTAIAAGVGSTPGAALHRGAPASAPMSALGGYETAPAAGGLGTLPEPAAPAVPRVPRPDPLGPPPSAPSSAAPPPLLPGPDIAGNVRPGVPLGGPAPSASVESASGLPRRVPRASLQDAQNGLAETPAAPPVPERPRDAGRVADAMAAFASGTRAGRHPGGVSRPRSAASPDGPPSGEHRAVLNPHLPDPRGREQK
ncbi:nitrate- and nitrite sensing domain-containing protein [Yinghuangia sp. ASG 101]|uniref:nitrate- and nitrite sensing domain-containing protein n=1 Tax=Yinghuangia sp. ASG 101 TaxID=2896848 RepID=UPI001E443AE2|nr:nitrate- and nitrite sensing domain-containing protein [Yinghuangia sp. ASG 101]UGQ10218.1 nitrate- and nitrite sensing domain-containing protein [Yinghuangia sp. ASG 101]